MKPRLTVKNFPTAKQDAEASLPPSRYEGPESAYRLAFTDTDFLLREELRPVRMQLELLKPEMVQSEQGIESTIVIFGSARIAAAGGGDERARERTPERRDADALRSAEMHRARCRTTTTRRARFAALVTMQVAQPRRRRSTSSRAAAPASWKQATAAPSRSAARASA